MKRLRDIFSIALLFIGLLGLNDQGSFQPMLTIPDEYYQPINIQLANTDYSDYLLSDIDYGFNWKGLAVTGWNIGAVILEAVGDGLYDDGKKYAAHSVQAAGTLMLLTGPFVLDLNRGDWLTYGLNYVFMRVAFFDPTYNITRGLDINHIGTTSNWDRFLGELAAPPHGYWFGRSIFFVAGVSIPLNYIY